jgi:hypothetical protein
MEIKVNELPKIKEEQKTVSTNSQSDETEKIDKAF